MSRIQTTVVIDRAIDDVWLFLSDPNNLPAWCQGADDVTPQPDGPFRAGTRLLISGRIGLLRFRSTMRVIDLEPHRAIELRSIDGLIAGSLLARADLEPEDGRTRLTVTSRVGGLPGWLAVLSPGTQTDRDAFFARLKQSCEAQSRPAAAPAAPTTVDAWPSRTEPDRREPDPAPPAEPRLVEPSPNGAEHRVAPTDRTEMYDAEESTAEAERGPGVAEEQDSEAEQQVKEAEKPPSEEGVPLTVREASAADEPTAATRSEVAEAEIDPAASREPAAAAPPDADGVRAQVPHEPAGDERLMLRLETERGSAATFEIPRSGATIGRAAENTVRLDDLSVSRRHARISHRQGGYWLSDLKSASGTWVDEKKLSAPRRLVPDQIIRIGILRLRVVVDAASDEIPTNGDAAAPTTELAGEARRRR